VNFPAQPSARGSGDADRLVAEAIELRRAGRRQASAERFERALAQKPDHAGALTSYAMLLLDAGDAQAATDLAERAVKVDPERMSAHHVLGRARCQAGDLAAGIASLKRAVALRPDAFEVEIDLGKALYDAVALEDAERHLRHALDLAPLSAEVHIRLGNLYRRQQRHDEALAAYRRAVKLDAGIAQAHNNLGTLLAELGDGEAALAALRQALALAPDRPSTWSNLLLASSWSDRLPAAEIAAEHRAYGRHFGAQIQPMAPIAVRPFRARRLKIGYVSSDFRGHAVAVFMQPLLTHHDRQRFEIYGLYNFTADDEVTAHIRRLVEHFVPVAGMTDGELAEWIRGEGIDILVDLNGHTAHNRLPLFLLKPAPIQVTWLGYLATTGLPTMDYRLTDARADPPGRTDSLHTETLWRLPDSLWCYEPHRFAPAVAPLPALRTGHLTFASLNNPAKVSATILGLWARILQAVSDARLLLIRSALDARTAELERFFAGRGVDPRRVEFLARRSTADYLALYDSVDVALDTWPCAGGTTTCDALWMGVPTITLAGERSFSRSGASVLAVVGMPELVTETADDYVARATALAENLPGLATLRDTLRERVRASPLVDARRFASAIEHAYVAMAERALAGAEGARP
jgi:predicted O-linked N-acetylglucosamine transferase (SPINDLY family)